MTVLFEDMLLMELDQEMAGTRRALERIPQERLGWRPHEKSPTLAALATHLVTLLGWAGAVLELEELDLAAPDAPQRPAPVESVEELLARFERVRAETRTAIERLDHDSLTRPWSLRAGERVFFTQPKFLVLRAFVFSHHVHHRAQLALYLRLNDVPLPQLFGPTADEPM